MAFAEEYRPVYEMWQVGLWGGALVVSPWMQKSTGLPQEPFYWVMGFCLLFLCLRFYQTLKQKSGRELLVGSSLEFTDVANIKRVLKTAPNKIWLGYGFDWRTRHTQKVMELTRSDNELVDNRGGAHWLHGLEKEEEDVFLDIDDANLHMLIAGMTGSGKTVMLNNLIMQAILRK